MRKVNYKEFHDSIAESLKSVTDKNEVIIVSRPRGKSVVVMNMDEYNSIQETFYLDSSKANNKRLREAIDEMNGK